MRKRWERAAALVLAAGLILGLNGCSSVVARVNGQDITRADFHKELEQKAGLQVLRDMILNKMVLERAKAEGCLPDPKEVQARFDKLKADRFKGDEKQLRDYMKATGQDDKTILAQLQTDLAVFKLRAKGLDLSDGKLQAFFNENRTKLFDKPERVSFRQIVVPSADVAAKVIAEANSSQEVFQSLVAKYSLDEQTKENGGLVEEIDLATLPPAVKPLSEALAKLKENQVCQTPIKIQNSYIVVKLTARHAAEKADFAKIKEEVKEQFIALNGKKPEQVLAECGKGAQVVVLEERFKSSLEAMFSAGGGAPGAPANVPGDVQKNIEKAPEMTGPTRTDDLPAPAKGAPAPAPAPADKGGKGN
ncbi:MAG: peptidyl-prolyl cis-trans isomerase [Armatimonadetes bacterium]|nr:peptidyl-prolyl cis-trans isomerase [Armatimonadota bacterium]